MQNAEQASPLAENKMGTMPIGRLLASMAIPMMISMMVQAFYNVVDSVFVARVSENALNAVSLAFPLPVPVQLCDLCRHRPHALPGVLPGADRRDGDCGLRHGLRHHLPGLLPRPFLPAVL